MRWSAARLYIFTFKHPALHAAASLLELPPAILEAGHRRLELEYLKKGKEGGMRKLLRQKHQGFTVTCTRTHMGPVWPPVTRTHRTCLALGGLEACREVPCGDLMRSEL